MHDSCFRVLVRVAITWGIVVLPAMSRTESRSPLRAVPFTQVKIADQFWRPRQEVNRRVSIPHSLDMLKKSGNFTDLELAAAGARKGYIGPVFIDSDLYKAVEAASYSLASHRDPALEARVDEIIAKIAAAQQSDGYLNTWYQVNEPDRRWSNLRDNHELYCAGHLFEAAAAHYAATGKRSLLDVAVKLADNIDSVFGSGEGKREGYCGHPEIELALIKLADVTGDPRYLELSKFFVESRGSKFFAKEHNKELAGYDGSYWQDNVPIRDHNVIIGHAVRAAYLMSAVVDIAARTGDKGMIDMLDRVWRNTTERNMYITGGIGPSAHNEGFTHDYDLPNSSAYQETCASIAMAMWNHRMNLLHGDSRYADVMERSLYNGVLAGVSLDGTRFFYVNPLASDGRHERSDWFGCACCPPNVTRTLAQLGGYAYVTGPEEIRINLYVQGSATADIGGTSVTVNVETDYPWDGRVVVKPQPQSGGKEFALRLRIPGWSNGATLAVNGSRVAEPQTDRGYFVLRREWKQGDTVELLLPMPTVRIAANPKVVEDIGLFAVQRGPLVYCLEDKDNETSIARIGLPPDAKLEPEFRADLLGGVTVLKGKALVPADTDWSDRLYAPAAPARETVVTAIPYYAWANRGASALRVWLPPYPRP